MSHHRRRQHNSSGNSSSGRTTDAIINGDLNSSYHLPSSGAYASTTPFPSHQLPNAGSYASPPTFPDPETFSNPESFGPPPEIPTGTFLPGPAPFGLPPQIPNSNYSPWSSNFRPVPNGYNPYATAFRPSDVHFAPRGAMWNPPPTWFPGHPRPVSWPPVPKRMHGPPLNESEFNDAFRPIPPGTDAIMLHGVRDFMYGLTFAVDLLNAIKGEWETLLRTAKLTGFSDSVLSSIWSESLRRRADGKLTGVNAKEIVPIGGGDQRRVYLLQNACESLRHRLTDVSWTPDYSTEIAAHGKKDVVETVYSRIWSQGADIVTSIFMAPNGLHHLNQALADATGLKDYLDRTQEAWETVEELRLRLRSQQIPFQTKDDHHPTQTKSSGNGSDSDGTEHVQRNISNQNDPYRGQN